jgi:hypothetical protein
MHVVREVVLTLVLPEVVYEKVAEGHVLLSHVLLSHVLYKTLCSSNPSASDGY